MGRNFRQPSEGLGFDGSGVAPRWRSEMIWRSWRVRKPGRPTVHDPNETPKIGPDLG